MTIIIDYDNDAIRFGHDEDIDKNNESKIITFRQVKDLDGTKSILCELANMIIAEIPHGLYIGILKQDEGQITTIEEY